MYCEQCGALNEEGTKFCTSCGAKIAQSGVNVPTNEAQPKKKKKLVKKLCICAGVFAAVVFVGTLGYRFISSASQGGKSNMPVAYVKDGAVFLENSKEKESYRLSGSNSEYFDSDMTYYPLQISDDGKTVFFADDFTEDGFRLYCRKTDKSKLSGENVDSKGIRIANNVYSFQAASNGKFAVYKKGDRLYYSNLKNERSITNEVSDYYLSNDLKMIIFRKSGGDLYLYNIAKDEIEKIDVEISNIVSENGEYKKLYYIKGGSLYLKEYGKDKIKIAADVYNANIIDDTVYVTKKDSAELKFDDLFSDDCAQTDVAMRRPEYSDFKTISESGWTETDYVAYHQAERDYNAKLQRDNVRSHYREDPVSIDTYSLYKIVGGEMMKIEDNLLNSYVSDKIIEIGQKEISKLQMSKFTSYNDAVSAVEKLISDLNLNREIKIVKSDGKIVSVENIDMHDSGSMAVSDDEKYFYCIEDIGSDGKGTLYRYAITETGLADKREIYDTVMVYYMYGDDVLAFSGDTFGIYTNDKYTSLAYSNSGGYKYEDGAVYYLDEYSSTNGLGNLIKYKNGKKEQIDIDVHQFTIKGQSCYYIKDFSSSRKCGDLYTKKGKKAKKIDTDVSFILNESGR